MAIPSIPLYRTARCLPSRPLVAGHRQVRAYPARAIPHAGPSNPPPPQEPPQPNEDPFPLPPPPPSPVPTGPTPPSAPQS